MSENTESSFEPEQPCEPATCEQPVMLRLIVTRAPDDPPAEGDGPIESAACSVEAYVHLHTEPELRAIVGVLGELQARIEAKLLLGHLQRTMPSDLLAEMLDQLGDVVVVNLGGEQ